MIRIRIALLLLLVSLFSCSSTISNLNENSINDHVAKKNNGYCFLTVTKDFGDITTADVYYYINDDKDQWYYLFMNFERGKFDNKIYCYELPAGTYLLNKITFDSFRGGSAFRNVSIPFTVKEGAVTYLHSMIYSMSKYGYGAPEVGVSDNFNADMNLFKSKFPKFKSVEFIHEK